jgi:hypothetical protein
MDRFASFAADWDAEEVRTLIRLLAKLAASKVEVGRRAPPRRARRRWPQPDLTDPTSVQPLPRPPAQTRPAAATAWSPPSQAACLPWR